MIISLIFFLGYNAYLVDHSLVNLKLAVDKISDARTLEDAKKIKRLIAYPIRQELAKKKLNAQNLVELEYIEEILGKTQNIAQVEDAKTFLKEVINRKEKERGAVLASLDTVSKTILPVERAESRRALKRQEESLKKKIKNTKDKKKLQELYLELDAVYTKLKEFDQVETVSSELIKLDPKSYAVAKAKFTKAWAYKQKNNFKKAKDIFAEISNEYADDELGVLSLYQITDTLYKEGKTEEAIKSFAALFDKYSSSPLGQIAQFRVGAIYLYDLKDYEAAAVAFNKLSERYKRTNVASYVNKKILPYLSKRYRKGGYYLLSQERFREADESFSRAIKINPKDAQSYTGRGLSVLGLGDKEAALNFTRQAVELTSDDWLCVANLGYVYIILRMYDEAEKNYKRAMLLNSRIAEIYYNLGYIYAVKNKFKQAIPQFKKAIMLKNNFSFAYNNLAYSLWHENNFAGALAGLKRAVELEPVYLEAHYNLGLVYESMASYDKALEEFEIVLRLKPNYRDIAQRIENIKKRTVP